MLRVKKQKKVTAFPFQHSGTCMVPQARFQAALAVSAREYCAHAPQTLSAYPPADLAIERIGDLLNYDFPAWFRPARAVDGEQETT